LCSTTLWHLLPSTWARNSSPHLASGTYSPHLTTLPLQPALSPCTAPAPAGEDEAGPAAAAASTATAASAATSTTAKGSGEGKPWSPKGSTQSAIDARFKVCRSASGKKGVPKEDYQAPIMREGSATCAPQVGGGGCLRLVCLDGWSSGMLLLCICGCGVFYRPCGCALQLTPARGLRQEGHSQGRLCSTTAEGMQRDLRTTSGCHGWWWSAVVCLDSTTRVLRCCLWCVSSVVRVCSSMPGAFLCVLSLLLAGLATAVAGHRWLQMGGAACVP
jgi:hypothetical protein